MAGWRRTNKPGKSLCNGFQHGTCTDTVHGFCSEDGSKVHQCALCLDNRHGAKGCKKDAGGGKDPSKKKRKTRRGAGVIKKGKP